MLRFASRVRALGVASALAITSLGMVAPVPASANGSSITWGVQAGNADDLTFRSVSQEVTTFYNARTFVHPGDHVLFTPVGGHTVTFNPIRRPGEITFMYANPAYPNGLTGNTLRFANRPGGSLLNSGGFATPPPPGSPPPPKGSPPPPPPTFTLNIGDDAAGAGGEDRAKRANGGGGEGQGAGTTYQYFCMFHRDMTGFITVLPAGARLPFTKSQNELRADHAKKADLARGAAALRRASSNVKDTQVAAGLGVGSVQGAGADSILRFAPARIDINVGDRVTWINKDLNAPHTVTFGAERRDSDPTPDGSMPGFFSYGGPAITSTGDQVNSGWLLSQQLIDYVNAGSLIPPPPIFEVRQRVSFTFTSAGTYPYFCALHDTLGMVGTVVVHANNQDGGGGNG